MCVIHICGASKDGAHKTVSRKKKTRNTLIFFDVLNTFFRNSVEHRHALAMKKLSVYSKIFVPFYQVKVRCYNYK